MFNNCTISKKNRLRKILIEFIAYFYFHCKRSDLNKKSESNLKLIDCTTSIRVSIHLGQTFFYSD